jgi:putative ABC transport system permease protein
VGLPVIETYVQFESPWVSLEPAERSTRYTSAALGQTRVTCALDIEKHIRVSDGKAYGPAGETGVLPVWVLAGFATEKGLQVNEKYLLTVDVGEKQTLVPVRIIGVWEALDAQEPYWYHSPFGLMGRTLLTTPDQYESLIAPLFPKRIAFAFWYFVLDDRQLDFDRAQQYVAGLRGVELEVGRLLPGARMDYAPVEELERGQQRKASLSTILFAFSLPLLGILAFFVASASAIVARYQNQETAVLASRGSSRAQIIGLAMAETLLIAVVACPLGAAFSLPLARLLWYAQSFLEFQPRAALEVRLAPADWQYAGIVLGICVVARLLPAWQAAASSIVLSEQQLARRRNTTTLVRLVSMLILIGLTTYTYQRLTYTGPLGLLSWRPGAAVPGDPLLILGPSLFFFAAPLVAAEVFALLMHPLLWLGRLSPSPAIYMACLSLSREGGQYRVPIFLLVLCLSSGVFYASLARSADNWLVDRVYYQVGADLTFEPGVELGRAGPTEGTAKGAPSDVWLIPISEYRRLPGVQNAARVAAYPGQIPVGKSTRRIRVLAVDQESFARVAFYRVDFSLDDLGTLLNRLGSSAEMILLPTRLASQLLVGQDDNLPIHLLFGDSWQAFTFRVAGTYDYFPTMYEAQEPVAIISLGYLERQMGGVSPHKIWIQLTPGGRGDQVLQEVKRLSVLPLSPQDARELVASDETRPERIGIFGVLSLCFLAGAFLAMADLLLYYLASIRGRSIRFAMLQAMGMRRSELMGIVSLEYVVTLCWGILAGAALGAFGSRLYVPFFALTEDPGHTIPPFIPVVDWQRAGWMAAAMGLALVVIGGLSLWRLVRGRVFEILRLGIRE